jgi:hypothetical protein
MGAWVLINGTWYYPFAGVRHRHLDPGMKLPTRERYRQKDIDAVVQGVLPLPLLLPGGQHNDGYAQICDAGPAADMSGAVDDIGPGHPTGQDHHVDVEGRHQAWIGATVPIKNVNATRIQHQPDQPAEQGILSDDKGL